MKSQLPIENAGDTAFTRQLKRAIASLYQEVRRLRMQGDGATFFVTETAGGLVGHATAAAAGSDFHRVEIVGVHPNSPTARPRNVIGGHAVGLLCGSI